MMQSLYTAVSGLMAQQYNIDAIGNNIANVGTTAFQSGRADFADALYQQMKKPLESGDYLAHGTGMFVGAMQRLQNPGMPMLTGSPTDFMVDGSGYFALQNAGGQTYFTRDGSFRVSVENGRRYLVSAEGYHVLGANNRPIEVPGDVSALTADSAGNLYTGGVRVASFKLTEFPNPSGLMDAGGNRFTYTPAAGTPANAAATTVRQGWLEGSNVDLAGEMTRLMRAQKAYAVMGSAIRTVDEMESQANNIGK